MERKVVRTGKGRAQVDGGNLQGMRWTSNR